MIHIRRILVPVDFARLSEKALHWAIRIAKGEKGSRLFLLHVRPPVKEAELLDSGEQTLLWLKHEKAGGTMKRWIKKVPRSMKPEPLVARGNTADEIVRVAREKRAQLIVMVTHGRRGLSRALQGSVTEETARKANCPVLVLHAGTPKA